MTKTQKIIEITKRTELSTAPNGIFNARIKIQTELYQSGFMWAVTDRDIITGLLTQRLSKNKA